MFGYVSLGFSASFCNPNSISSLSAFLDQQDEANTRPQTPGQQIPALKKRLKSRKRLGSKKRRQFALPDAASSTDLDKPPTSETKTKAGRQRLRIRGDRARLSSDSDSS